MLLRYEADLSSLPEVERERCLKLLDSYSHVGALAKSPPFVYEVFVAEEELPTLLRLLPQAALRPLPS